MCPDTDYFFTQCYLTIRATRFCSPEDNTVKIGKKRNHIAKGSFFYKPNCRIPSLFNYPDERIMGMKLRLGGLYCAFIMADTQSLNVLRLL